MKISYVIIGIVALLYWRVHNGHAVDGTTRVDASMPLDGTNPATDMWSLLQGIGLSNPSFPNILPGPNADGGGHTAQSLNLQPAWDGSLP